MTDLIPEWRVGSLSLTEAPYLVPFGGVDYGNPENVTEILRSLLQDGDIEVSSRTGNRTLVLPVLIEDADMAALAEAEAALGAECDKPRNEVYVDPGDGFGAPFIFDVFRGQVVFSRDDTYEQHGYRSYTLTFRALPSARSVEEVSVAALAATGTTTTSVDNGSSATGWTSTTGTPVVVSGAVAVSSAAADGTVTAVLTRTGAVTTSSLKYLLVDWSRSKMDPGDLGTLLAHGDGVLLEKVSEFASPTAGYVRSTFYVSAASVAVLKFSWTSTTANNLARTLSVDQVSVSDVKPGIGTSRQLLRAVDVIGSARTQGALTVEGSTSLGDALVYTYPDDPSTQAYSPPLRQFRHSGNTVTTDVAQVSGSTEPLNASEVAFRVPVGLFPAGAYLLLARLKSAAGGTATITYETKTVLGSNSIGSTSDSVSVTTTTSFQVFTLGRIHLPTVDLDPTSSAYMSLGLTTGVSPAVTYDEVWLFNTTIGQLVRVDCGTAAAAVGGPAKRIFIEPATVAKPRPTVRVGHSSDGSDSYYPTAGLLAWEEPVFAPPRVNVFTVTPNATDVSVSMRYFPRWSTHAGQ